jgi:glutaredoxin
MNLPGLGHPTEATTTDAPSVEADTPAQDDVLIVYGTSWCGDCHRTVRFLKRNNVPYRWVDADEVPGATELITAINRGRRTVPTLVFPDGSTMSEPSNPDRARRLGIEPA